MIALKQTALACRMSNILTMLFPRRIAVKLDHGILQLLATFTTALCFASSICAQPPVNTTDDEQKVEPAQTFLSAKRVVFLGDSITYHGGYIVTLESILRANGKCVPEMLNLGLSSETCSGDSEPIHPFPRPNVHERLRRLLKKIDPDLLVVNYGMNDGIYHPFSKTRFENYQLGINKIIHSKRANDETAKVVLITPIPFDPLPLREKGKLVSKESASFSWKEVYENYDSEVLETYAKWILKQRSRVVTCIDLRTPFLEDIQKQRETQADFRYAHDGVHVNANGHQLIGMILAESMGLDSSRQCSASVNELIKQRQTLLRDSWLSEVGHKRPGIKPGLPINEATAKAKELNERIQAQIDEDSSDK